MVGRVVGKTSTPRPLPRYVDANSLRLQLPLPDNFVPYLAAMVEVGRGRFGDAWGDAEQHALAIASLSPDGDANSRRKEMIELASRQLVTAIVNQRVRAFYWSDGLSSLPRPLPLHWLTTGAFNLSRRGSLWRDRRSHHVFCGRSDLDVLLTGLEHGAAATRDNLDGLHVSLDLKLAMAVIQEWQIKSEAIPAQSAIQARVFQLASEWGKPISEARAQRIARTVQGHYG